jgi:hypothetical protein
LGAFGYILFVCRLFIKARTIYTQKTKNVQGIGYLENTVDFKLLEQKAKSFQKNV